MTDETMELIWAIKKNKQHHTDLSQIVIDYYSEYSGSPKEEYTDSIIFNLVKNAFLDYLSTANHPDREMKVYFDTQNRILMMEPEISFLKLETKCILIVFQLAQVRDHQKMFINGFRAQD